MWCFLLVCFFTWYDAFFYLVWCVKNSLNFFSEVMIWCSGACVHNFVWCDLCKLQSIVYMGLSCKVEKRFLIFKFSDQKFNSCQNSWKQWLVAHLSSPRIWILVFLIFLFLNNREKEGTSTAAFTTYPQASHWLWWSTQKSARYPLSIVCSLHIDDNTLCHNYPDDATPVGGVNRELSW